MNCPHCQKVLSENQATGSCPYCGKELSSLFISPVEKIPETWKSSSVKINWLLFFVVFLAPPILTMLSAMADHTQNQSISPAIALVGSPIAGLICGMMLSKKTGRTISVRVITGLLMGVVAAAACLFISCIGCNVGGYNMSFH